MMMITFKFLFTLLLGLFFWFIADTSYHFFKTPGKRSESVTYKESSNFNKLFFQFPEMLGKTLARYDPNCFDDTGFILFTGKQGSGKTCAMTHYINLLKAKYPDLKIQTNYNLLFEDSELTSWKDIVGRKNGGKGYVSAFDEISIVFNNRNWKNFDPAFFSTIVQNRKQKRLILGTAQNISLCDKALRTQVTQIRECSCFFGFFVLVRKLEPDFDTEGNIKKLKPRGMYFFIQSDFLRELYDTSYVIDQMGVIGYDEK